MPTIALVDDDRNILTSVGITLEAEGYQVQKYSDGAAALQGLQDAPPDMARLAFRHSHQWDQPDHRLGLRVAKTARP